MMMAIEKAGRLRNNSDLLLQADSQSPFLDDQLPVRARTRDRGFQTGEAGPAK